MKPLKKTKTARKARLLPCHRSRLLIVDDEKNVRDLFFKVLACDLPDYRVDLAVNGAEAVENFRQAHHSVILMDLSMPVMNGETAFEEIEKVCQELNWEMPCIIFCTGYDPSQRIRSLVAENSRHCLLLKPVTHACLVEAFKKRLPG